MDVKFTESNAAGAGMRNFGLTTKSRGCQGEECTCLKIPKPSLEPFKPWEVPMGRAEQWNRAGQWICWWAPRSCCLSWGLLQHKGDHGTAPLSSVKCCSIQCFPGVRITLIAGPMQLLKSTWSVSLQTQLWRAAGALFGSAFFQCVLNYLIESCGNQPGAPTGSPGIVSC